MIKLLSLTFLVCFDLLSTTSAAYLKGSVNDDAENDTPFDIDDESSMFNVNTMLETDVQFENDVLYDADGTSGRHLVYCKMQDTMQALNGYKFSCYCGGIGSRNSGLLGSFCTDNCQYCASGGSNCATATVWAYMNKNSQVTSLFNTITYTDTGRRINIAKYDCSGGAANSLDNVMCGRCTVKVDYNPCKSCYLTSAIGNARYPWGGAVNFDCSNLGFGSYNPDTVPIDSPLAVLSINGPSSSSCTAARSV